MRCPFCGNEETQVKDSRTCDDSKAIRRRRYCPNCDSRFTTYERVVFKEVTVVKKDGERKLFDRDKLESSIRKALRKRPVTEEQIESIVNGIVKRIESSGATEIPSQRIGEMVMDALEKVDKVAFIRFASVYKNFDKAEDFNEFVKAISGQ